MKKIAILLMLAVFGLVQVGCEQPGAKDKDKAKASEKNDGDAAKKDDAGAKKDDGSAKKGGDMPEEEEGGAAPKE